jgi:hypothetical protein
VDRALHEHRLSVTPSIDALSKLAGHFAISGDGNNDLWNSVFILNSDRRAYWYAVVEQYSMSIEQDTKRPHRVKRMNCFR